MSFNSSRTRVAPVFNYLLAYDPSGQSWLRQLLELAGSRGNQLPAPKSELLESHWWPREKRLAPPIALLKWLICNLPANPKDWGRGTTRARREKLVSKDPATIQQALRLLRESPSGQRWHILEGATQPDVFLATSDMVVVVEGKRKEHGPKTDTTWMPVRHQMLRHLDGAMEISEGSATLWIFYC